MNQIEMMRYYRQYQEEITRLNHLKTNIDGLTAALSVVDEDEQQSILERLEAKKEEYRKTQEKADELWHLSTLGIPKEQATAPMQFKDALGHKAF